MTQLNTYLVMLKRERKYFSLNIALYQRKKLKDKVRYKALGAAAAAGARLIIHNQIITTIKSVFISTSI